MQFFNEVKNSNHIYYRVKIVYDDRKDVYKCGQWYNRITLQALRVLNDTCAFDKGALGFLINAFAISMIYKDSIERTLNKFITNSWSYQTCKAQMCEPNI